MVFKRPAFRGRFLRTVPYLLHIRNLRRKDPRHIGTLSLGYWGVTWKTSFGRAVCNQLDHCIDVSICLSVCLSIHQHFMGATLCGPDLIICLPFTLDNDLYRQLRCRRCASNLLFWPWHFSDLFKRSRKTFIFQLNTLDGCHFVGTRSQKLFAFHLTQFTTPFIPPTHPFAR